MLLLFALVGLASAPVDGGRSVTGQLLVKLEVRPTCTLSRPAQSREAKIACDREAVFSTTRIAPENGRGPTMIVLSF